MQIGRLRDRVTLYGRTVTNSGGALVNTFTVTPPTRVPAQVESPTGERMERLFGSQVSPVATHIVTLRAWTAVDVGDRLVWHSVSDRTLEIRGHAAVGGPMRRFLVLACEERDAA
jgi:head-tail adaptor